MTVSVNAVNNDVQSRNNQLLANALNIAQNIFKVRMDDKQLAKTAELNKQKEDKELPTKMANHLKEWAPTQEGDPDAVALQTPDGQTGYYKLRSEMDKRATLQAAKEAKEADRLNARIIAGLNVDAKKATAENKPTTEGERLTAIYGQRLLQSNDILGQLENDPEAGLTSIQTGLARMLPNSLQGKSTQKFEQAKRNFLNAALRKESGASISPDERESGDLQYFPQQGDSPETLAQKAANRQLVIDGFKTAAGKAWENLDTTVAGNKKEGGGGPTLEDLMAEKQRRAKVGTAQK